MNLGLKPPPSARVPQLCFPLASSESLGSGTHGGAGLRLTGRAEGRERGEVWAPEGAPDAEIGTSCPLWGLVAGQWGTQEGWACKDLMQAQGIKASLTEQRGCTSNQSPDGWWTGQQTWSPQSLALPRAPCPLRVNSHWVLEQGFFPSCWGQ